MSTASKRPYDATRRRERAEQERQATKSRVIVAAAGLFLERGYVATTMTHIAREAGVAMQSVYTVGQSKAVLLDLVRDVAVAGDPRDMMLVDRPEFVAVRTETNPVRQVKMLAALLATTIERVAPLWPALQQAAAVDETAAANLRAAHERRLHTFTDLIKAIPRQHLRRSPTISAHTVWTIASPDNYLLQTTVLGWDGNRYRTWLTQTLVDLLLLPKP